MKELWLLQRIDRIALESGTHVSLPELFPNNINQCCLIGRRRTMVVNGDDDDVVQDH